MKKISIATIIIFALLLIVPAVTLNTEANVVSSIDNRELTENPFASENREGGTTQLMRNIDAYLSDRVGFREEMITGYTIGCDKLFNKMVHPVYTYGKDGYVFYSGTGSEYFYDFHLYFADMIKSIQDYCEERDVPFLFVFEPDKTALYEEFLPEGLKYDRSWVEKFLSALDDRGVNYIDNTEYLREKKDEGEVIFNKKYDAGHWNALGAFYGVNNILRELHKLNPNVVENQKSQFNISTKIETSLPVSKFPISEEVPVFTPKAEIKDMTAEIMSEVDTCEQHRTRGYYINPEKIKEGAPKALVFQGSYMNGQGSYFFQNAFGEYIHIHNYENAMDFPYYYNMFKPDIVVFEVTDFTISESYFNYERLKNVDFNQPLEVRKNALSNGGYKEIPKEDIQIEKGEYFVKLTWNSKEDFNHVWIKSGEEFDMIKDPQNNLYKVKIPIEKYKDGMDNITIYGEKENSLYTYGLA